MGIMDFRQVPDAALPSRLSTASLNATILDKVEDAAVDPTGVLPATFAARRLGTRMSPILTRKLRGANIVPKPGTDWPHLFSEWDWANWIKPQVDRAVALGLNAIRLIGAARVVFETPSGGLGLSMITQAQYDARWSQLAQYCLDQGLFLYPCLASKWDYAVVSTFQDATRTAAIKTTAVVLAGYSNVIAFDLFQEGDSNTGVAWTGSTVYPINYIVNNDSGKSYKVTTAGTSAASGGPTGSSGSVVDGTVTWLAQGKALMPADVLALFAAVRSVCNVPITMSRSIVDGFGWNDTTSMWYQVFANAKGVDFLDIHIYPEHLTTPFDVIQPGDPDFQILKAGKPFLIGEYGVSQNQSDALKASRFNMVTAIHNRRGVIGSFIWGLADQKTSANPEDQWGLFDNTGFAQTWPAASTAPLSVTSGKRTVVTDLLQRITVADRMEATYETQNLLNAVQAKPRNVGTTAASGWLAGGNTSQFSDGRGLGFTATAIGTSFIAGGAMAGGTAHLIPVAAATYYRGYVVLQAGVNPRAVSFNVDWYDASKNYLTSSVASTGTSSVAAPLTLDLLVKSHASAAYGVLIAKVTDAAQPAGESHYYIEGRLAPTV